VVAALYTALLVAARRLPPERDGAFRLASAGVLLIALIPVALAAAGALAFAVAWPLTAGTLVAGGVVLWNATRDGAFGSADAELVE
jgi:hypothetical protein